MPTLFIHDRRSCSKGDYKAVQADYSAVECNENFPGEPQFTFNISAASLVESKSSGWQWGLGWSHHSLYCSIIHKLMSLILFYQKT